MRSEYDRWELVTIGTIRDLTNNTYGFLKVIRPIDKRANRKVVWECECVCGNKCEVLSTSLTSGRTKSCGCKQYDIVASHYREKCPQPGDIINGTKILGYEYRPDSRGYNECYLLCECKFCKSQMWVRSVSLKNGNTKSCGCIGRSHGEAIVEQMLVAAGVEFEKEKTFVDCFFSDKHVKCRFDFFVDNRYFIEFDGQQHYKAEVSGLFTEDVVSKIKERDQYKNKWCAEHNIPLIRIPFYALDDIKLEDLVPETSQYLIIGGRTHEV